MIKQIYNLLNRAINEGFVDVIPAGLSAKDIIVADSIPLPDTNVLTPVGFLDVALFDWVGFQIQNIGSSPFTAFAIQAKFAPGGEWLTVFDEAGDYNAPPFGSPLKGASSNLTVLGAGTSGWFNLDVSYYAYVRLLASSAGGTSISVLAGGKARVNFVEAGG